VPNTTNKAWSPGAIKNLGVEWNLAEENEGVRSSRNNNQDGNLRSRIFLLKSNMSHTTTEVTTLPHSFDWKLKIEFLAHFYSRNAK
jgi:hypothetical protein